jgi:hypothetical protein
MKNADSMLKVILTEVDTSGDGKIQYEGELDERLRLKDLDAIAGRAPPLIRPRRSIRDDTAG